MSDLELNEETVKTAAVEQDEKDNASERGGSPTNTRGDASPETTRADEANADEYIKIRVLNEANHEVHYRIKRFTTMARLMRNYIDKQVKPGNGGSLRFTYDGNPLNGTETPADLGMDNEDVIDVYDSQTGGF